jgi:hypothetical protein
VLAALELPVPLMLAVGFAVDSDSLMVAAYAMGCR